MWDWIKKAAGEALERGAEYLRHAGAIQQIINMPSYEAAIQQLRHYIYGLGSQADYELFMSVVSQQIQQAQLELHNAQENPGGSSWGNSFEDQMAQGMAEIQAGIHSGNSPYVQAAQKKLHDLGLLDQYARQFWMEAQNHRAAPPTPDAEPDFAAGDREVSPADRLSAFQRHMQSILDMGGEGNAPDPEPDREPEATDRPLDELEAFKLIMDADKRLMRGMMGTMPGTATPEIIADLDDLYHVYERIQHAAPTDSTLIDAADLFKKMGQCMDFAGRACESLRDDERALGFYHRAAEQYAEAGDDAEAGRIDRKIRDLEIILSGDHDSEITALHARLEDVDDPSIDAVETLTALGEACTKAGDSFMARDHLRRAEAMLETLGIASPTGEQMARDLLGSVDSILSETKGPGPTSIEVSMKARMIYKRLYQALSAAYSDTDPDSPDHDDDLARADEYHRKLEEMEGGGENRAFGEVAMKMLQGQYANLLKK